MKSLLISLLFLTVGQVMAQEVVDPDKVVEYNPNPVIVEKKMTLRSHDTEVITLNRFMHIDRILVEARASTLCGTSNILISVDGYQQNKQSLWIPSNLTMRNFIVEMKGYSGRTLQIENEGNCKVIIKSIKVLPRRPFVKPPHGGGGGGVIFPGTDISYFVLNIQDISIVLADYVSDQEVVDFLGPWKRLSGKALAAINATGPTSSNTRAALIELVKVLDKNENFIDKLISMVHTQDLGYQILEAKTFIEKSLL